MKMCSNGDETIQTALDLVEHAKEQDKQKNYLRAFELYMQALEYFVIAARSEYNKVSKSQILINKKRTIYLLDN
jgi:hypothetical protein